MYDYQKSLLYWFACFCIYHRLVSALEHRQILNIFFFIKYSLFGISPIISFYWISKEKDSKQQSWLWYSSRHLVWKIKNSWSSNCHRHIGYSEINLDLPLRFNTYNYWSWENKKKWWKNYMSNPNFIGRWIIVLVCWKYLHVHILKNIQWKIK